MFDVLWSFEPSETHFITWEGKPEGGKVLGFGLFIYICIQKANPSFISHLQTELKYVLSKKAISSSQ